MQTEKHVAALGVGQGRHELCAFHRAGDGAIHGCGVAFEDLSYGHGVERQGNGAMSVGFVKLAAQEEWIPFDHLHFAHIDIVYPFGGAAIQNIPAWSHFPMVSSTRPVILSTTPLKYASALP